ncbi:MAG TPA: Holliday junction resolvase RuvX [Pyrinomonadaceae bacterium]|nr:Holliday junction resolvase RuvX [Pyrinomonadaceae bacterium]
MNKVPETSVYCRGNQPQRPPAGKRLLAFDLGTKRVGVAVSDELLITVRALPYLQRTNWKKLLRDIAELRQTYDAQTIVIGLPLRLDGSEGEACADARRIARNLSLSLDLPVWMQDERLTSRAAEESLRDLGLKSDDINEHVAGAAAALILRDFIAQRAQE